jgi:transposase InsO family protein
MAWDAYKLEQQRLQLVLAYINKEASMTSLCTQYRISRKTGYKWVERYQEYGESGLKDLSRAPDSPKRAYEDAIIYRAIDYKLLKRNWGPKKIAWKLKELYPEEHWPSSSRLHQVFKEHHLVKSRKLRGYLPGTAALGDFNDCNDTWTVDRKGWFITGDGYRCEPLTITDCASRYAICCEHLSKHTLEYVWPIFEEAFREYGLPDRVRSDNGPPFGSVGVGRLTKLSVNLIKAGVTPEWTRPAHPEENGRHERFHLTLQIETADPPQETLAIQIQEMKRFLEEYNFERPHESLGMKTPGSCYQPSKRVWDGILRSPEYDRAEMDVRKVGLSGTIWIKQTQYYIGESLIGEYVGLKPNENEELEVYYGPIYLGKIRLGIGFEKPKQ